jgi:spore germination protein GerM
MTVRLAWVEAGENALGVERSVPYSPAVATAAMNALLAGPTLEEQATWPAISTAIPAGTKLLGLTIEGGIAKVDLSKEFESGGGTFSVTARLAQVVYTLTQFPSVTGVEFYVEGQKVEMFSSEGLILDGPQTIDDYANLLPMDA